MSKKLNIAALDDETAYEVDLLRPVQIGRSWARPGLEVVMKGKVIKEHAEDVADVRPIAD